MTRKMIKISLNLVKGLIKAQHIYSYHLVVLYENYLNCIFMNVIKKLQNEDKIIGKTSTPWGNRSKKEGKDQESIQPGTTPDPGYQWKSNKLTIRHHKREPRGQPFPSR